MKRVRQLCVFPDCGRQRVGDGLCDGHYRQRRRGSKQLTVLGSIPGGTKVQPIEARFWRRVRKSEGCWEWTGAANPVNGYAQIAVAKRGTVRVYVHRLSWQIHFGAIADGLQVCHHCDNRICVRPDHLFLGTQKDNMHDMIAKGRKVSPRGEQHFRAKLTTISVTEIRAAAAAGIGDQVQAKQYGVNPQTIGKVVRRKLWAHVA